MQPQRTVTPETPALPRWSPEPRSLDALSRGLARPVVSGAGIVALAAGLPATPEALALLEAAWRFD